MTNSRMPNTLEALRTHALADEKEIIHQLTNSTKDFSAKDEKGHTALHLAVVLQKPTVLTWLISQGARIDTLNHQDETPLITALKVIEEPTLRMTMVNALLKPLSSWLMGKEKYINHAPNNKWHETALCLAAYHGDNYIVKALLKYNAYDALTIPTSTCSPNSPLDIFDHWALAEIEANRFQVPAEFRITLSTQIKLGKPERPFTFPFEGERHYFHPALLIACWRNQPQVVASLLSVDKWECRFHIKLLIEKHKAILPKYARLVSEVNKYAKQDINDRVNGGRYVNTYTFAVNTEAELLKVAFNLNNLEAKSNNESKQPNAQQKPKELKEPGTILYAVTQAIVEHKEPDCIQLDKLYLTKSGKGLNLQDEEQNTALHLAAARGWVDTVNWLINKKADITLLNARQQNALVAATWGTYPKANRIRIVNSILTVVDTWMLSRNRHNYLNQKHDNYLHATALHWSAVHGDTAVVQVLLDRKVEVNFSLKEDDAVMPNGIENFCQFLETKIKKNQYVVTPFFKEWLARTYALDDKFSPLLNFMYTGVSRNQNSIIRIIPHSTPDDTFSPALISACFTGHRNVVDALVAKGANTDIVHDLCQFDAFPREFKEYFLTRIQKKPLQNDKKRDEKDQETAPITEPVPLLQQPLAYFNSEQKSKAPSVGFLQFLIDWNFEPNIRLFNQHLALVSDDFLETKDENGNTVLHLAAIKGKEAILRCLISRGAKIDNYNLANRTPLIDAIDCIEDAAIRLNIVNQLLAAMKRWLFGKEKYLNHAPQKNLYDTALCRAVIKKDIPVVKALLQHGASHDFNLEDLEESQIASLNQWIVTHLDQLNTQEFFQQWIHASQRCLFPHKIIQPYDVRLMNERKLSPAFLMACWFNIADIAALFLARKTSLYFPKRLMEYGAFLEKYRALFAYHLKLYSLPEDAKNISDGDKRHLAVLTNQAQQHGFMVDAKWNEEGRNVPEFKLTLSPAEINEFRKQAYLHMRNSQWESALAEINKVIIADAKCDEDFAKRGVIFTHLKKTTAAFADFATAIKLNPKNPQAYGNRGWLYYEQKEYQNAIEDITRAIEFALEPSDQSTLCLNYSRRSLIYTDLGEFVKAIRDWNATVQLNPQQAASLWGKLALSRAVIGAEYEDLDSSLVDVQHWREPPEQKIEDAEKTRQEVFALITNQAISPELKQNALAQALIATTPLGKVFKDHITDIAKTLQDELSAPNAVMMLNPSTTHFLAQDKEQLVIYLETNFPVLHTKLLPFFPPKPAAPLLDEEDHDAKEIPITIPAPGGPQDMQAVVLDEAKLQPPLSSAAMILSAVGHDAKQAAVAPAAPAAAAPAVVVEDAKSAAPPPAAVNDNVVQLEGVPAIDRTTQLLDELDHEVSGSHLEMPQLLQLQQRLFRSLQAVTNQLQDRITGKSRDKDVANNAVMPAKAGIQKS